MADIPGMTQRATDLARLPGDRRDAVLLVCPDDAARVRFEALLEEEDLLVMSCETAADAERHLAGARPDLLVLWAPFEEAEVLRLLERVRQDGEGRRVPALVLADDAGTRLRAYAVGADDVARTAIVSEEFRARVRVRLERRPVPRDRMVVDTVTGALTEAAFEGRLIHEAERVGRGGRPGAVAYLSLHELPALEARLGARARDEVLAQLVEVIEEDGRKLDLVGLSRGHLALLMPNTPAKGAQTRLERLAKKISKLKVDVDGSPVRLTPSLGYAVSLPGVGVEELKDRAWTAVLHAAEQLDLHPVRWRSELAKGSDDPSGLRRGLARLRTPLQVGFQQLLCFGLPFFTYVAMDRLGLDVTGAAFIVLVVALALTALAIMVECRAAFRRAEPPPLPDGRLPRASAVIAAYLPNESRTVVETVQAFLRQDYPDLQVILAYNTPEPLPVEELLREIAEHDPRFVPLRVEGSVSKAQNVNAALASVTGEFVGIFDADHHPAPGSFERAWRWLSSGVDVVQGHCVVRNGGDSWVTRLVAAEFEAIYAVAHPGRARLHGFGIFGGSNGYWRRDVLERTRLRSFMLTEDIDSSLRVLRAGGRIVSDPGLVSTELAPDTPRALWNQRMRWAQGWSQVAMKHLHAALRSPELTLRQKLGCLQLLGWRELYPWASLQTLTILLFWAVRGDPPADWFIPVFVFTTLLTFSAGPVQSWTAWRLAHPSIKRERRWFLFFGVVSQLAYVEVKNVIARTAHIKEAMRERRWKVTPRAVASIQLPPAPDALRPSRSFDVEVQPLAAAGGLSTANGSVTASSRETKR
jgi:cellulose synthase/poly-beta-1,6-N-acetylglucosamine synthase-like glycosyltransferase/GGDEF domain-containing protein